MSETNQNTILAPPPPLQRELSLQEIRRIQKEFNDSGEADAMVDEFIENLNEIEAEEATEW